MPSPSNSDSPDVSDLHSHKKTPRTVIVHPLLFVILALLAPPAIFGATFYALYAVEKTALPWLTIVIAPGLILLALPRAIKFGKSIIAVSHSQGRLGFVSRAIVYTSVIWAPLGAWQLFIYALNELGS